MMDTKSIFESYERIRSYLPSDVHTCKKARLLTSTQELLGGAKCFFLDAYGVLNLGEEPIIGALEFVKILQEQNIPFLVLSNSASFSKLKVHAKLNTMGFALGIDDVITSREVLFDSIKNTQSDFGVIAPKQELEVYLRHSFHTDSDFWTKREFLFLSTINWNATLQKKFASHVKNTPCKIWVANPDISAPQHTGAFSKEPGFYTLVDEDLLPSASFIGKPFPLIFEYALLKAKKRWGVEKEEIMMVGDTLHTDVLGANTMGLKSALIEGYGFFKGHDASFFIQKSAIFPDVCLKYYS